MQYFASKSATNNPSGGIPRRNSKINPLCIGKIVPLQNHKPVRLLQQMIVAD